MQISGGAISPAATRVANPPQGRRRERRTAYRVLCRLLVVDKLGTECATLIGQTVNLSTTGLAVRVAHELPVGTNVRAIIPRKHREPSVYDGSVAHCRRVLAETYEIGVEFKL